MDGSLQFDWSATVAAVALSNEKYTPVMPTPRLKFPPGAQFASVAAACLEHGCMSTRSFADAAMTLGLIGSTASIGSFCPFRGNELAGLATLTRAPVALAD